MISEQKRKEMGGGWKPCKKMWIMWITRCTTDFCGKIKGFFMWISLEEFGEKECGWCGQPK